MTEYHVNIKDRTFKFQINKDDLRLNDRLMDQELIPLNQNGLFLIRNEKNIMELHMAACSDDTYVVLMSGMRLVADIENGKQLHSASQKDNASKTLQAPMPGRVIEVPLNIGDQVEKGTVVLVLESMKMQMQLRSDSYGSISHIAVSPGEYVEKGTLLIRIE